MGEMLATIWTLTVNPGRKKEQFVPKEGNFLKVLIFRSNNV